MSAAPRVRIESDGTVGGNTHVYIDGTDVTNNVTSVTWHLGVGDGPATAEVTFHGAKIDAEAELAIRNLSPWPQALPMPPAPAGSVPQPWHRQAVAAYDAARGGITEHHGARGLYTAAQVNEAIAWWNGQANVSATPKPARTAAEQPGDSTP